MSESTLLYLLAGGNAVSTTIAIVRRYRDRNVAHVSRPSQERVFAVIEAATGLLLAAAIWCAATMLFEGSAVTAARALAVTICVSLCVNAVTMWIWPRANTSVSRRAGNLTAAVIAAAIYGFVAYLGSCPQGAIWLTFPLRGDWRVITGGRTRLTNYHHGQPPSQDFAVDLVFNAEPAKSIGQPVFAPCDCKVARVTTDREAAEGNLVVLETADNVYVWLAHLKDASIRVQSNEQVGPGQLIAEVGDTGSAESAHLHIHAEKGGQAVPVKYGKSQVFLVRGGVIRGED